jgi:hypothetical protein
MNHHQVTTPASPILGPTSFWRILHLKDNVKDPSSSLLHTFLQLLGGELHILGVCDFGRVIVFLQCRERALWPKKDASVAVLDEWVVQKLSMRRMGRKSPSAICWT